MTKNIGSTSVHPWRRRREPWRGSREAHQVRMIMIMRAFNVTVMVMLVTVMMAVLVTMMMVIMVNYVHQALLGRNHCHGPRPHLLPLVDLSFNKHPMIKLCFGLLPCFISTVLTLNKLVSSLFFSKIKICRWIFHQLGRISWI